MYRARAHDEAAGTLRPGRREFLAISANRSADGRWPR